MFQARCQLLSLCLTLHMTFYFTKCLREGSCGCAWMSPGLGSGVLFGSKSPSCPLYWAWVCALLNSFKTHELHFFRVTQSWRDIPGVHITYSSCRQARKPWGKARGSPSFKNPSACLQVSGPQSQLLHCPSAAGQWYLLIQTEVLCSEVIKGRLTLNIFLRDSRKQI